MPVAFTDMTLSKSSSDCSARNNSAFDTGVVARAVKSTKGCHGACDQTLDVRSVGDVCLNKNCVSRLLSFESNCFAASIAVQIGHNNLGTFVCKFERSSTANPRPAPVTKATFPDTRPIGSLAAPIFKTHIAAQDCPPAWARSIQPSQPPP